MVPIVVTTNVKPSALASSRSANVMNVQPGTPLEFVERYALNNYSEIGCAIPLRVYCEGRLVGAVEEGQFWPSEML